MACSFGRLSRRLRLPRGWDQEPCQSILRCNAHRRVDRPHRPVVNLIENAVRSTPPVWRTPNGKGSGLRNGCRRVDDPGWVPARIHLWHVYRYQSEFKALGFVVTDTCTGDRHDKKLMTGQRTCAYSRALSDHSGVCRHCHRASSAALAVPSGTGRSGRSLT